MGADLCISHIFLFGNMDMEKRKKNILRYLEGIRNKELFEDFLNETGNDDRRDIKEIKKKVEKVIMDFFDCLNNRDVTWIGMPGATMYISGGMSCGDSPTDPYSTITDFSCLPEEILEAGDIGYKFNMYDMFMDEYKKELPDKLKKELRDWWTLKKI